MTMKNRFFSRHWMILAIVFFTGFQVFGTEKTGSAGSVEVQTPTLTQMLIFAIQDEWAARAEYQAILKKWPGAKPFNNIVSAEESHIRWLIPLFSAHKVLLPIEPRASVVVPTDWAEALAMGAQAEVLNIAMYERFLTQDLPADVKAVFLELKRGSENHLRAFKGGGGNSRK